MLAIGKLELHSNLIRCSSFFLFDPVGGYPAHPTNIDPAPEKYQKFGGGASHQLR